MFELWLEQAPVCMKKTMCGSGLALVLHILPNAHKYVAQYKKKGFKVHGFVSLGFFWHLSQT